jgi:hypothetical protein
MGLFEPEEKCYVRSGRLYQRWHREKSKDAMYSGTRKSIVAARHAGGRWLIEQGTYDAGEAASVTSKFEVLRIK